MISKVLETLNCFRVTLLVDIEKGVLFAGIKIATRRYSERELGIELDGFE
jgi:hypothetical protein